jgi:hypothetical protein
MKFVIARSEATTQSSLSSRRRSLDCFASLAMTGKLLIEPDLIAP